MKRMFTKVLLAVLAVAGLAACAEGVGDIDRVQPNYYDKAQFQGLWYYRQTVIDVPYENSWLFEGIASDVEKIRWEIQEGSLVAYRVNELVPGANGEPDTGRMQFTPVAAWPISSHFDKVRDYNPSTGEETNVIIENTTDRSWWERQYIRVDWADQLVPNTAGIDTFLTKVAMSGANDWIQPIEEDNPDRFELTPDYMGIVNKFHVEPDLYACYMEFNDWFGGTGYNCGPSTIKVRSSFMKVDELAPKYESLDFPDRMPLLAGEDLDGDGDVDEDDRVKRKLTLCGHVTVNGNEATCTYVEVACSADLIDELASDPFYAQFGYTIEDCVDAGTPAFERFGYFRTEHISYDRQYGHTETGRIYKANRHDIWENAYGADGQPLPYGDRTPKPIVYHLNPDFPVDLYLAAAEIEREFDGAFRETVEALQGRALPAGFKMFEVRPNSCSLQNVTSFVESRGLQDIAARVIGGIANLDTGNLEQMCAALEYNSEFRWQKNGDLRYHFIYWVDRPQLAGPLGFGPSYADPDTGQIISGTAYVYGAGVDTYAASATDIVEVMAGRITLDDLVDADTIRETVRTNMSRARRERGEVPEAFFDELKSRMARYDRQEGGRLVEIPADHYEARLQRIKGTSFEKELFIDEHALAAFAPGYRPGAEITPEMLEAASPATVASSRRRERHEAMIQKYTAKHCALMSDFVDGSIVGLAMQYDAEGKTRDEIYSDLRHAIFVGVMLHEVGHTVGLRHNFNGSYDALNYFDDFWRYRSLPQNPEVAKAVVTEEEAGRLESCIQKAQSWQIPVPSTLECLRGSEFKYSSIMDYGAKFNSDLHGLGKYDKAAIRFGYGQLIDVWDDSVELPEQPLGDLMFLHDYTKIPDHLRGSGSDGLAKITARRAVRLQDAMGEQAGALLHNAANLPRIDGSTYACSQNCLGSELGPKRAREVPYKFCSDEFAGWGYDCKRWDEGGNQREIVESAIDSYRNYYFFWAFKRDRFNWDVNAYLNRLSSRVFNHFTAAFQWYYFFGQWYDGYDVGRDLAVAAVEGLNLLGEVIQTPEPGKYCLDGDSNMYYPDYYFSTYQCTFPAAVGGNTVVGSCTDPQLNRCIAASGDTGFQPYDVKPGVGRYYYLDFSDEYSYKITRVGSFYEKLIALFALTDSDALFYRVDDAELRNFSINFYRLFKGEMLDLVGGLVTKDYGRFAGRVRDADDGLEYQPQQVVAPAGFTGLSATQPDDGAPRILPRVSYQLQWYAALLGMARLTSTLDSAMDFRNYFKVSLKGSVDDQEFGNVDLADPDQYAEFTDPTTHYTYRAVQTADGQGFAFRLVKDALRYHEDYWLPAKAALDAAQPGTQAYQDAYEDFQYWDQVLSDRIEFIDDMRLFQRVFEFGG